MFLHSLGLAVLAIYTSLFVSLRVFSFWWIVLVFVLSLMAPSSPTRPQNLAHSDDLASEATDSHPPPQVEGVENPRLHMPSSSNLATFSEALILGVGGQSSAPIYTGVHESTIARPSEVPPPSQSISMPLYVCWGNLGVSLYLCP